MDANRTAILVAAAFFVIGAILVALFHKHGVQDRATTLIVLMLVPLAAYGIASGKILELTGPGGLGAKFQAAAHQKVGNAATPLSEGMRKLQTIEKRSQAELRKIFSALKKGEPVALILHVGRQNYYVRSLVEQYVDTLREFDQESIVVLVDYHTHRFVAMSDGAAFLSLLRLEQNRLITAIEKDDQNYLKSFPQFLFKALPDTMTNAEALKEMRSLGAKIMVVVNKNSECYAVVKRDDIVAHVLADIAA